MSGCGGLKVSPFLPVYHGNGGRDEGVLGFGLTGEYVGRLRIGNRKLS